MSPPLPFSHTSARAPCPKLLKFGRRVVRPTVPQCLGYAVGSGPLSPPGQPPRLMLVMKSIQMGLLAPAT